MRHSHFRKVGIVIGSHLLTGICTPHYYTANKTRAGRYGDNVTDLQKVKLVEVAADRDNTENLVSLVVEATVY
jgi:hypothetical protein